MSKYIKLFKQNINIGGSFLPADFPYLDASFFKTLQSSDFNDRIKAVYSLLTNRSLSDGAFKSVENSQYPASVVSVDDGLNVLELFDGSTADYTDYIFDKSDALGVISSLIAVFCSAYCDLVESGQLNFNETFNLALPYSDGAFLLSAYIAKKIGLPISVIICATQKPINEVYNGLYFSSFSDGEVDTVMSEFFDEYDYPLDPISAESFIPLVSYSSDYDDDSAYLMPALVSPYKFTRRVLKAITNKNQLDVVKAERLLFNETAMEIPPCIENNATNKFFSASKLISIQNALDIIKQRI